MRGYLADAGALARKDLLLELRARDTLPAMLLFVVSVLVVFHFALPTNASARASLGLLWVAILFTALLGLYFLGCTLYSWFAGMWMSIPFLFLFCHGYCYMAVLSYLPSVRDWWARGRRAPIPSAS